MSTKGFEIGGDGPSVLVVGIDGSDTSWRAMYYALGLARRQRCSVIAVFAVTTAIPVACDGTLIDMPETGQGLKEMAAELRNAVQGLAEECHVSTRFVCAPGDPVLVLGEIAAEHGADAIIIGASQAFTHRFFGSIAVRAIRRCQCPVTVVP